LVEVIESYRFELEMDELVEILRALDILGPEKRLLEYEGLLYIQLAKRKVNETGLFSTERRF
jgi:hypothetical protein